MTSPGPTVSATSKTAGAAAATLAHQRQPEAGDGSDPVGVSSRMKPTQASPMNRVAGL
jgi:hypothetical protein